MPHAAVRPWNPDHRWADPMLVLLLLLALLTTFESSSAPRKPRPPAPRPSLQARLAEVQAGARTLAHRPPSNRPSEGTNPWDHALHAILLAEAGQRDAAVKAAQSSPSSFRAWWLAAYEGGEKGTPADLEAAGRALGHSYAFHLLQARLQERDGVDSAPSRALARKWLLPRLGVLAAGGLVALGLALTGLVGAGFLAFRRAPRDPVRPSDCPMPWRAAALAFLGWFVALRFSGTVAAHLVSLLSLPPVFALPVGLSFHIGIGAALLLRAEGTTLTQAWRRMTPRPLPRALGWSAVFLGIAFLAVLAAGLLAEPFQRQAEPPQRELWEVVAGSRDMISTLLLISAMAGLAPLFEEWLFRGALLPWLGHRLARRWGRAGWPLAVGATGLLFGAMHLQPAALPALCTLGTVLGWAFLHTRNLWTAVAIHACWNGSVFLLIRVLA